MRLAMYYEGTSQTFETRMDPDAECTTCEVDVVHTDPGDDDALMLVVRTRLRYADDGDEDVVAKYGYMKPGKWAGIPDPALDHPVTEGECEAAGTSIQHIETLSDLFDVLAVTRGLVRVELDCSTVWRRPPHTAVRRYIEPPAADDEARRAIEAVASTVGRRVGLLWAKTAAQLLAVRDDGSWSESYETWRAYLRAAAESAGVSLGYLYRVVSAGDWYRGYVSRTRERGVHAPVLAELDCASDTTVARIAALWRRGEHDAADGLMSGLIDGSVTRREVLERCA